MRRALSLLFLIGAILGISLLRARRGSSDALISRKRFLMGTVVEVRAGSLRGRRTEKAIQAAFQEMERIDSLAGRTSKGELFQLNQDGEAEVPPDLREVIAKSIYYGDLTRGSFDITVQPILRRWSYFEDSTIAIPGEEELAQLLPTVDYRRIRVEGYRVSLLGHGMGVDLGGIAKGYAVDKAALALKSHGITSALVEAGGDIRVIGSRPGGSPWRIGLRHPREDRLLTTFELSDRSICTSGDYERFFERNGVRYHHILDPRVGHPAKGCCSVTVIAGDATTADVLATGVFVLGAGEGMALIDSLEDVEAVIVSDRGGELEIKVSKGLEGKLDFDP